MLRRGASVERELKPAVGYVVMYDACEVEQWEIRQARTQALLLCRHSQPFVQGLERLTRQRQRSGSPMSLPRALPLVSQSPPVTSMPHYWSAPDAGRIFVGPCSNCAPSGCQLLGPGPKSPRLGPGCRANRSAASSTPAPRDSIFGASFLYKPPLRPLDSLVACPTPRVSRHTCRRPYCRSVVVAAGNGIALCECKAAPCSKRLD